MRAPEAMVCVFAVSALVVSGTARADDSRKTSDQVTVRVNGNVVTVEDSGGTASASKTGIPAGAKASSKTHPMAEDMTAVHVVATPKEGSPFELVLLRRPGSKRLEKIWSGETAMRGDLGERSAEIVRFEDLTGDSLPEIVIGTLFEPVRICGAEQAPLLFRKVYDPRTRKLRFVAAGRPGLPEPVEIDGTLAPGGTTDRTVEILTPSGVSRTAGDGAQVLMLTPPGALVDGDPSTAWYPGNGTGAGEFACFVARARSYGISRVGIRAASGKRAGRIRSLLLETGNGAFRLRFPEDARPGDTVWFETPEPITTDCLTLIVEQAEGSERTVAIAEVAAVSEVEGPKGYARLAADLSSNERGEEAARLLTGLGDRCVDPIAEAWTSASPAGKRRAVNVIAEAAPKKGAKLLARAVIDDDTNIRDAAVGGLARAPKEAVAELAPHLDSDDEHISERAVQAVARVGGPLAVEALAQRAGEGSRERRALLRKLLTRAAARSDEGGRVLSSLLESAEEGEDRERLLDLLRAGAEVPSLLPPVVERARGIFAEDASFDDRYRALQVLAAAADPALEAVFIAGGAQEADARLRALCLRGLAELPRSDASSRAIFDALDDDDISVRLVAVEALLGAIPEGDDLPRVVRVATGDPWPEARAGAALLLAQADGEAAVNALVELSADDSPLVRVAALRTIAARPEPALDEVIIGGLSPDENLTVIVAAIETAARRCSKSAVEALAVLLKKGAQPLASSREIELAVAAAAALSMIGGDEAEKILAHTSERANPAVERATKRALEKEGARCDGAKGESE